MSPTSPRQIQIDPHLPTPARHMSITSPALSPARALGGQMPPMPQRSSTTGRSYRDDPEGARERQMQQDIESAMSMSRARSGSHAPDLSPNLIRPSAQRFQTSSPIEESPFPMLSDAEEAEMDRARASGFRTHEDGSDDGHGAGHAYHLEEHDEHEAGHDHRSHASGGGSSGFDSHARLLRRHSDDGQPQTAHDRLDRHPEGHNRHDREVDARRPMGGMAMNTRNNFDFGAMEQFASKERETLGVVDGPGVNIPTANADGLRLRSGQPPGQVPPGSANDDGPGSYTGSMARTNTFSAYDDVLISPKESEMGLNSNNFARRRQRKLSASNPVARRGGKLAMFEGFGSGGGGEDQPETPFKAARQPKNALPVGANGFQAYSDAAPGHDKPYRFSFYSNRLPVTIHARTLAELPAEGQTFEDLFKGRGTEARRAGAENNTESIHTGHSTPNQEGLTSGVANGGKMSLLARAAGAAMAKTSSQDGPTAEEDPEGFTWWLDVQSPTDEEMRMLSRVFGIHPLTTEDILLEETREKIELFRNYYLVCFRSFDQDPYSQTYLEPLNMYIIVFREGTLSFHFRGTPHPQNVRRRIKHLKDYISVTSDWISYALIDDITDAFGPLIQSIEYEVDSIDELVLILKETEQSDMLRRIGTCRKKVMGLLRLMGNKADVVKGLAKRCNEQWLVAPKSDIGLYLSDIQDHLITMTQNLNHYEKILSRSHSNYLAQISIEMTDANNQINDVLSKLTALGTVLIPMNLVTGLWGMNVHVPGQDITEGYAWFGGILGCLCAFAILGAFATYKCFVR